jgi:hypothetical protein
MKCRYCKKEIKSTFYYEVEANKNLNGDGYHYSTMNLGNACENCFKKLSKVRYAPQIR